GGVGDGDAGEGGGMAELAYLRHDRLPLVVVDEALNIDDGDAAQDRNDQRDDQDFDQGEASPRGGARGGHSEVGATESFRGRHDGHVRREEGGEATGSPEQVRRYRIARVFKGIATPVKRE